MLTKLIRYNLINTILLFSSFATASDTHPQVVAFAQDTMANDFRKNQVFEVQDELAKSPGVSFIY